MAALFECLVPHTIVEKPTRCDVDSFTVLWKEYSGPLMYKDDTLTDFKAVAQFQQWRTKWHGFDVKENVPSTLIEALRKCDPYVFNIIHNLLKIGVTLPISTATPERTFSALRLMKAYLRNRTEEDSLNGLAHMYINNETVDIADVIRRFKSMKQRRLVL